MQGTYDPWLVTLSIVVAVLASFASLDLAGRVVASTGRAWKYWLAGGALCMGLGIWSMHFIGMLAFHLPIPIVYDITLTIGSIVSAILSAALALYTIRYRHRHKLAFELAGLMVGIGIAAMHYTGMAAIPVVPPIRYNPALVTLSVVIAVVASYAALQLAFRFRKSNRSTAAVSAKLTAAVVMGLAIATMHYCAMYAAEFASNSICRAQPQAIDPTLLAVVIGAGAVLLLASSIMVSIFDAHMAQQNAETMQRYNFARMTAEQANRAKSQFLAVMSHELRTPLNAIIGFTEALVANVAGPLNARQIEYLRDVGSAGRQLLSLVNDILDLSKIEAERYDIKVEPINLHEAVSAVVNLIAVAAESGGISIDVGVIQPDHRVCADPRAFRQILVNVLSNSVKFTFPGGSVSVVAKRTADGTEVAIADTGIGIAPEHLDTVTQPFRQLDDAFARARGGTGLGLTIVEGLMAAHGGTFRIESDVGVGTTVFLLFPDVVAQPDILRSAVQSRSMGLPSRPARS